MATTTFDRQTIAIPAKGKSFGRRLLDRFIDAQMHKAQLRVNAYLQSLSDAQLAQLGYDAAEIGEIHRRPASTLSLIV